MYVCASLFLSVYVWRTEDNLGCHSLGSPLFLEVGSLLGLELA